MSRSWERKVQKNQQLINKQRKKQGQAPMDFNKSAAGKADTYKGRSIMMPAFLLLFTAMYVILSAGSAYSKNNQAMFWVTIGCYVFLALLFVLRRPYLTVGKDYLRTRRFGGDRTIYRDNIKSISAQKGYVVIGQNKGGNWVFSRLINRYPIEEMTERLRSFAAVHHIPFEEK